MNLLVEALLKADTLKPDIVYNLVKVDSVLVERFDLENLLTDSVRGEKISKLFTNYVEQWIITMLSKESIMNKSNKGNLFLLPYTKSKLGLK